MRISDWSSDVCSSDLGLCAPAPGGGTVGDLVTRVLDIAAAGLAARGEVNSMGDNEVGFLEPLRRIAKSGKSPAPDLLDRYAGARGRDLAHLYAEMRFQLLEGR